jgi:hypothetical protein
MDLLAHLVHCTRNLLDDGNAIRITVQYLSPSIKCSYNCRYWKIPSMSNLSRASVRDSKFIPNRSADMRLENRFTTLLTSPACPE